MATQASERETTGASRAASARLADAGVVRGLLIFALALLPRMFWQGRFVTVDESYHWFDRAQQFLKALRGGDWAGTNLIGHPGVTTMWLGALGQLAHQWAVAHQLAAAADADLARWMLRAPVAIATAACVALGYALLRRLLDAPTARLAALLWAGDPFLIAHSQLLHVDALVTSFMMLALLAALLAFRLDRDDLAAPLRWPLLLGSGAAGGLALLTKSPAVVLLPMLGLIALVRLLRAGPRGGWPASFAKEVLLPGLAWLGVAGLVWVALWPAAWVNLPGAIGSVLHQAESDGGSPHGWGNFFLGRAVADPGPLFYPLAVALRLTPWTLLGLLAALLGGAAALRRRLKIRLPLLLLGAFALLFMLLLSVAAKKFDRYVLPIFPALDVLAAAGLIGIGAWLSQRLRGLSAARQMLLARAALLLLLIGIAGQIAWYHPYELAYYNPLLGGGAVAERLIPVGWGEGLEQAGDFLSAQPDRTTQRVATWYRPTLKPFIAGGLVPLGDALLPDKANYAVLYIDQVQRRDDAAATDWLQTQLTPIKTIQIHGIDYAEIYRVPPQPSQALTAEFGPNILLRGYDLDSSTVAQGFLRLTLHWRARAPSDGDLMLFVHVLDEQGQRIGGIDVPPGGGSKPSSQWQAGEFVSAMIQVPVQSAPARAWIVIGLYDSGGARLELRATAPDGAPADGPNALPIGPIVLK